MIEDPTPHEIAFRLIASYHGGSQSAQAVFDAVEPTRDDLASIGVELVQIASVAIALLAEELNRSHEQLTTLIEQSLDKQERSAGG